MKKRTHFALSRQLLRDNSHNLGTMESALFCVGSIFPDCSPLCLIRPHKFDVTNRKSKKRMVKVISGKYNRYADCFRLGCLSHHVADYFTAPHNRTGLAGFCMDHRGYENELHKFFKNQLRENGAKRAEEDIRAIEFWKQMSLLHVKYMERIGEQETFDTDYSFIIEQITLLFGIFMDQRRVAWAS